MNAKGKIAVLITIAIFMVLGLWFLQRKSPDALIAVEPTSPISIIKEEINEENFTGSRPVISGGGILGDTARNYIEKILTDFKAKADVEVPQMKEELGSESPTGTYTIDIQAEHVQGETTESIVVSEYYYTGGANGTGLYTVFTASLESEAMLSLSDVILVERREDFASLLRSKLMSWRPSGASEPVVFIEDLGALTFDDLSDWSMDEENLTIYFDEYEVGPGALGAFAFPIPLSELTSFLMNDFAPLDSFASLNSIEGCYVARIGENSENVYTLRVDKEESGYVSGFLSYNNFEKDSSSGPFVGMYKDGILKGDYSFQSEGMFSISEVIFKKEGETFVQGFGEIKSDGNKTRFINPENVSFDPQSSFVKEVCSIVE